MAQKLSYNFQSNGWDLKMTLNIEEQKPIADTIKVNWSITGISEGEGTIDLIDGKLYTQTPVIIEPYEENGNPKTISAFKIEKFRMIQIRGNYN